MNSLIEKAFLMWLLFAAAVNCGAVWTMNTDKETIEKGTYILSVVLIGCMAVYYGIKWLE